MMYEGVLLFAVVFLADYLFDTLTQSKHGLMLRGARQAWLFFAIGVYFLIRIVINQRSPRFARVIAVFHVVAIIGL